MDASALQRVAREDYNLRLNPAMSRYLAEKVQAGGGGVVAVIGGDAHTGRPKRVELPLDKLAMVSSANKSELS
jgi:hypothetical protein